MLELLPLLLLFTGDDASTRTEGRSFWGLASGQPFRLIYSGGVWAWSEGKAAGTESTAREALLTVFERIGAWSTLAIVALDDSGKLTIGDMLSDGPAGDAFRGDLLVEQLADRIWKWRTRMDGTEDAGGELDSRAAATFAALDAWAAQGGMR